MRKLFTLAVAALAVATLANAVNAQLNLFFDTRDSIAAINTPAPPYTVGGVNGGGRGSGQVAYVSPTMPGNQHIVGAYNASLRTLTLYGDFQGNTGEILSSLGLNISIASPAAGAQSLGSVTLTTFNTQAEVGGITSATAWDGTNVGTVGTTGVQDFRAVRVPVAAGPVFDSNLGIKPGNGYRLLRLNLAGGARTAPPTPPISSLNVFLAVGDLLITRVSQAGAAALPCNFGYVGANPEALTGGATGSTAGGTSATADAVIVVTQKGDYNNSGSVTNQDVQPFLAVRNNPNQSTTVNQRDMWLGDLNNSNSVTNQDITPFLAIRAIP